jgi:hypothetical protein
MLNSPDLLRRLAIIEGEISSAEIAVRQCRTFVEGLLRKHDSSETAFALLDAAEKRLAQLHVVRDAICADIRKGF